MTADPNDELAALTARCWSETRFERLRKIALACPEEITWSPQARSAIADSREMPPRLIQNWDTGHAVLVLPHALSNIRKR